MLTGLLIIGSIFVLFSILGGNKDIAVTDTASQPAVIAKEPVYNKEIFKEPIITVQKDDPVVYGGIAETYKADPNAWNNLINTDFSAGVPVVSMPPGTPAIVPAVPSQPATVKPVAAINLPPVSIFKTVNGKNITSSIV